MEFDSPEEKEFPGLYASEANDSKSKKSKEESDYSEGGGELGKKDLLSGRRKDKKDKGKDRGYAALEGESSPEEELDTKSPNKSKKSKTFKFTSSKSKEKREKSRDKDVKDVETSKEKEKDHKKKDKERKEKEKKEKSKDKDKKDKKVKQTHSDSDSDSELALCYPVFGVSVSLAVERSRCHDGIELPLVVRECIDYLQEHSLAHPQIYKIEPFITDILHFKRLYNHRERKDYFKLDTQTACSVLKLFIRELPEPMVTTDLMKDFEKVASQPLSKQQRIEFQQLIEKLPKCNQTLLAWVMLHFKDVSRNIMYNNLSITSIAMLLQSTLRMSHSLVELLIYHSPKLFPDVKLIKYVPPLNPNSPNLPENVEDIQIELRKQESLIAQIHYDMNAGFITKKLEEQLWEVQRIITQLKRKLRSFEKKQEKSIEEVDAPPLPVVVAATATEASASTPVPASTSAIAPVTTAPAPVKTAPATKVTVTVHQEPTDSKAQQNNDLQKTNKIIIAEEKEKESTIKSQNETQLPTNNTTEISEKTDTEQIPQAVTMEQPTTTGTTNPDGLYLDSETGLLMVPRSHPHFTDLLRLQFEYQELLAWKLKLQTQISGERAETLVLRKMYAMELAKQNPDKATTMSEETEITDSTDYDKIIEKYVRENKLLEAKKIMLAKQLFEEKRELIALEVEYELQKW